MLKYVHPTTNDIPKIAEWIAADPAHRDIMKAEDFVLLPDKDGVLPKGVQCVEVQDDKGTVFYLRFRNALIVETQFPPDKTGFGYLRERVRIAKALKEAFAFFSVSTRNLGYHAMFFNSVSESLIQFFEKLGFSRLKDHFKADL